MKTLTMSDRNPKLFPFHNGTVTRPDAVPDYLQPFILSFTPPKEVAVPLKDSRLAHTAFMLGLGLLSSSVVLCVVDVGQGLVLGQ
jgi:hypothetical protein